MKRSHMLTIPDGVDKSCTTPAAYGPVRPAVYYQPRTIGLQVIQVLVSESDSDGGVRAAIALHDVRIHMRDSDTTIVGAGISARAVGMQLSRVVLTCSVGFASLTSMSAPAESPAVAGNPLSTMDFIEIEFLAAKRARGWDTGKEFGYQFADAFTHDAVFVENNVTTTGRADLAARARSFTKANPMYVGRFIANHAIESSPEGATGYLYELVVDKAERKESKEGYREMLPSTEVIQSGGLVKETYVRTPKGWRIKRHEPVASAAPQAWPAAPANAAPTPGGVSAQDNVELRQLVARYAYALDSGLQNGQMLANLFAVDGELIIAKHSFKGRDAIAQLGKKGWVEGDRPPNAASHFMTNQIVEMSPSGPIGKQFMIKAELAATGAPGKGFTIGGRYEDQYVRTAAGWRFKRREYFKDEFDNNGAVIPVVGPLPPAVTAPLKDRSDAFTPAVLTADDYVDIRQLDSRYAVAVDLWTPDVNGVRGETYARNFTPDAEFHASPMKFNPESFIHGDTCCRAGTGHAELRRGPGLGGGPNYVNHFNFNRWIEPTATGARGEVYLLTIFIGHGANRTEITTVGHYAVEYEKTPDGWRISHRDFYASTPVLGEGLWEKLK